MTARRLRLLASVASIAVLTPAACSSNGTPPPAACAALEACCQLLGPSSPAFDGCIASVAAGGISCSGTLATLTLDGECGAASRGSTGSTGVSTYTGASSSRGTSTSAGATSGVTTTHGSETGTTSAHDAGASTFTSRGSTAPSSSSSASSRSTETTGTGGGCPYATGTVDHDGDGWSPADGDCDDCNRYVNPGAYDIPGDGVDQDCDGTADDEPTGCDATLTSEATTTGSDGATAMDLCRKTTATAALPMRTWGVVSAAYVLPDGSTTPTTTGGDDTPCTYSEENFQLGFGILGPSFGTSNATQEGVRMLGLSSGTARQPTDPGYGPVWGFDKCYTSGAPAGFPGQTPACGAVQFGPAHDGAALQVVLRVPTNAVTMSFDTNLFSYEFPEWVCSPYNDTFVVVMSPTPTDEPTTAHGNVAFDPNGNVLSVNAGFLAVCDPTTTAGADGTGSNSGHYAYACADGPSALDATGFGVDSPAPPASFAIPTPQENHGSTGWLTTTVSVASLAGKSVTLLFAVWDSTDGELDTTVLVDNVRWTFATSADAGLPTPTGPVTIAK
jgi:hypothetical protein